MKGGEIKMAENLVNAGIGIEFKYTGMEQFNRLTEQVNNFKSSVSQSVQEMNKMSTFADRFSRDNQSAFNKIRQSAESSFQANEKLNGSFRNTQLSIRNVGTAMNGINDNKFTALNRTIENTQKITKTTTDNIKSMQKNVNGFKSDEINKLSTNMSKAGRQTKDTGNETKRAGEHLKSFRDTALGVFAGNALSSGMQFVENNFKSIFETGLQVNSTISDMGTRWTQAGLTAQQKNGMLDQIQEIRRHSDISAVSINNMQRQFLSMTGSATQAMALTNTVTSFSAAGNLKPQQEQGLTRLMSSNKAVNARMFQRTLGSSPNFVNEIIKQTGMSKNAFYSLLQAGKFTGQELRNAMIKASKDSNKAWSDYAKTTTGKMDLLKATGNTIKNTFASNLASGAFNVVNHIAGNSKQLDSLQKRLTKTAKDAGKAIGNLIGSGVAFVAKNLKPIESMAGSLWKIVKALASGAWNTITAPLKLISTHGKQASNSMGQLADRMKTISKHQTALKVIGGTLVGMFVTLKAMQGVIMFDKFVKSTRDLAIATKGAYTALKTFSFAEKLAAIQGKVLAAVNKVVSVAQWALNAAMDANPIGLITLAIAGLVVGVVELYKHFKPFRNLVNGTFKAIGKAIGSWWKQCQKNFKAVQKIIGEFAKFFKKYFGNVIKDGVKNAKRAFKVIGDVIRVFKDVFTLNFKDLGKVIPKLVGDLWKLVKGLFKEGADFVEDIGSNMWKAIWNTFKGWGKAIGNFFKDLWDGIGNTIKSGINDVIDIINAGIKGVDWVLSKVGGSGHTIGTIKHLATGTVGGKLNKNTMAMLNDGNDSPQTGNKEMAILPNGRAFIPQKRNWVGMLPKGSMVLNATQTRELMALRGIQHFSIGSVAGDIWNGAKSVVGSVVNGVKKGAWAVMHPIKFIKSLFHGVKGMSEFVTDFTGGLANKTVNSVISFFKQHSGGADNPAGAGVERWKKIIEQAGSFMHESLSNSDISLIMKRIARESGGNATIKQQISDVNSAAGHPAQGLLQYVPSTFASWAVKGHTNLLNGYDQLLAMFNDSNWRSDIANNGGWGPTGHKARKNGGPVKKDEWYKVNEAGFEMFKPKTDGTIINHEQSKAKLSNMNNRPINIDAHVEKMVINGELPEKDIEAKFIKLHQNALRQLIEQSRAETGINDAGIISL